LLNCIRRGLAVTAVAGLGVLAAAPGALASTTLNAYGAKLTLAGGVGNIGPLPLANLGTPTNSLPSINLTPLGSVGTLTASVTQDTAAGTESSTDSTGTIALLGVGGASLASATAISATCNATSTGMTGSSTFLNQQTTNPDGSLTVNAFHLTLGNFPGLPSGADLIIASATCGPAPAAGTPLAEGAGLYIGLGLLGAIGISVVYVRNRRRGTGLRTAG
jgi:hypothetical protein